MTITLKIMNDKCVALLTGNKSEIIYSVEARIISITPLLVSSG